MIYLNNEVKELHNIIETYNHNVHTYNQIYIILKFSYNCHMALFTIKIIMYVHLLISL